MSPSFLRLRVSILSLLFALAPSLISVPVFAGPPKSGKTPTSCAALLSGKGGELRLSKIPGAKNWGENVRVPANPKTRELGSITDLVIGQYNVENLLEEQGKYVRSADGKFVFDPAIGDYQRETPRIEKPFAKLRGVAETLMRANPDIAVIEEVENLAALEFLNEKLLGGKYIAILIPGNDERGINVAFLVKADLPFDLEIQSFKNVARGSGSRSPLFSRDLPGLFLRTKGAKEDSKPLLGIFGTHFKSQRDTPGDPLSVRYRSEQVQGAAEILSFFQRSWGDGVPLFLAGDFNRDVRTGPEFKPLWQNGLMKDAFDLAPADHSVPAKDRVTQTFHPREGGTVYSQLDSVSGSPAVQKDQLIKDAQIMPYLDENGQPRPLPRSFNQRKKNPSDHFMVRVVLDFAKLLKLFQERAEKVPN